MSATHMTVDLPKGFIVQAPPGKRFHEAEPVIVFRGQDALMAAVLRFYYEELQERGADDNQIAAVAGKIDECELWQEENAGLVKLPDYVKP